MNFLERHAALRTNLRLRIANWIFRRRFPEQPPVVLVQRRIYILPSRTGTFFALVLVVLLIGSINYSLSLGFLLTFLLGGMASVAMLHTFRNLARLSISPGRVAPIFAGDTAHFNVVVNNPSISRFSVGIVPALTADAEPVYQDIRPEGSVTFEVPITSTRRGYLKCSRLEIFTEYPVGLFHAWSYIDFGATCLVYPRPEAGSGALPASVDERGEGVVPIKGDDEFQSLRNYQPGDTPRQIDWKALARERGLLVKEFGSLAGHDLWLDYSALPGMPVEERLSRLTWWVLEACRLQLPYGLKLPGQQIPPALGAEHRDTCLAALALFGLGDSHAD